MLLVLAACHPLGSMPHDTDVTDADERIAVTPAELDFPLVSVNLQGTAVRSFEVVNLGDVDVTVTGQDEVIGNGPFSVAVEPFVVLAPGDHREIEVTFTPPTEGEWTGDLFLDPGLEVVHLTGAATAPVLDADPLVIDPVVLGCTGSGTVAVRNRGGEALTFIGAYTTDTVFSVVGLPDDLGPDETDTVELTFTPDAGGARSANLVLSTNDPAHPQTSVRLDALGYEGERVTESFRYAPSNPTDILFATYTGSSMEERLSTADDAVTTFVDQLRNTNVDYHVASLGSGSACPASTPGYAARTDTALQTVSIVQQGFAAASGAWDDDLLGLVGTALDRSAAKICLSGFRRAEADLHVVVLTDRAAPRDVGAQVADLAGRAEGDAAFRLSALVPIGGCGADADAWVDAARTTGGYAEDLCNAEWSDAFASFATLPSGADPVRYPLAELPVASTIEVTVEGDPFDVWSYDTATNAVVFDGDAVPALGAEVAIDYVRAVSCG